MRETSGAAGCVVLVVSPDLQGMEDLEALLREQGFVVRVVGEFGPALEALEAGDVALALLDTRIGLAEAYDMLAAVRASRRGLPVVLVGADCSSETMVQACERGASAFVARPLNPHQLLDYIRRVLKGVR